MTDRRLALALGAGWLVLAGCATAAPLLTTNDTAAIGAALHRLNLTESDLGFEKDVAKPRWALQWVRETLKAPLGLPGVADRIRAAATGEAAGVWRLSADLLEAAEPVAGPAPDDVVFATTNALNPHLAGFIAEFVEQAAVARQALDKALAGVPPAGRRTAAASLLAGFLSVEDHPEALPLLLAAGVTSGDVARVLGEALDLDTEPAASNLLEALLAIDLGGVARGGQALQAAAERLAVQARTVNHWPDQPLAFPTALGRVIVGTMGPDRHAAAALLVIDPGGDDNYGGEAGVANGLGGGGPSTAAPEGRVVGGGPVPVAAIIDLGGDDHYGGAGLLGAGSALFGLAVLVEAGGNDTYRAAYVGQGAAVGGAAWLADLAGDDTYRGGVLCQGAAVAGVAVLADDAGNDVYEVGLAGQAYSGVRGAGWLIDRAGDDRYLAGNRERDWDRHPDRFLTLAQGFSIGMRPFAGGGLAALVDLDGNDTYVADVYGQGVSYWYSAAFLLDSAGNDTYRMFHYGQGSGIHLSLGLLADEAGDDSYTGAILAQGNAHDYAVGLLIDRAGNDTYTAETYSQGRALYNAFGLLLEGGGDDAYFARQTNECQGLGHSGAQREYGGLALLVDEGGTDHYACGAANGGATLRPWYGAVWDGEAAAPAGSRADSGLRALSHAGEADALRRRPEGAGRDGTAPPEPAPAPAPPAPPVYEVGDLEWPALSVEQLLVLAQRPGNGPTHRAVRRDAGRELLWRGPAALEGMLRYAHLENNTILLRTQEQVDSLAGEAAAPVLARFLESPHQRTRRMAAYYLGLHGKPAAGPEAEAMLARLRGLLDDDETAGAAMRTLGVWRDRESVARLAGFLANPREPRRVAAANALREIGDPAAVPALLSALRDPVFTVRMTAQRALIALGTPAEKAVLKAWHGADPATRRHLLGVLAAGESGAARRALGAARKDPDAGVRADADLFWRER